MKQGVVLPKGGNVYQLTKDDSVNVTNAKDLRLADSSSMSAWGLVACILFTINIQGARWLIVNASTLYILPIPKSPFQRHILFAGVSTMDTQSLVACILLRRLNEYIEGGEVIDSECLDSIHATKPR